MHATRTLVFATVVATLAGCGILDNKLVGSSVPRHGSLIPDTKIQVTKGYATSIEKLALAGAAAATLYYVYRPLDPNWEGADLAVSHDVYRISLRMKRFHTGGDGEALQQARRYAEQLRVARGASGYTLIEFAEGIESSTPVAQRIAEAIVRLKDVPQAQPAEIEGPPRSAQPSPVPARPAGLRA
jgi:hypothetical protein